MAIATYADLQASVAAWLKRNDMTAIIPDLIMMAESRLSSDIDARLMESRATLSVSSEYTALPSDLLETRRLLLKVDPKRKLRYVTPDQITEQYPTSATGSPAVFSVIGQEMQLAPIPDATYQIELTYYQRIPALSATNTTNWLLTNFPAAYVYATLCEAIPYIVGDSRIPVFESKYQQQIEAINNIDWYSGATMTVRSDVRA